jgi:hypothetical protein
MNRASEDGRGTGFKADHTSEDDNGSMERNVRLGGILDFTTMTVNSQKPMTFCKSLALLKSKMQGYCSIQDVAYLSYLMTMLRG